MFQRMLLALGLFMAIFPSLAQAQATPCPEKNIQYWQAFPPGGESDVSARHQQIVLKKKCPNVDSIVQYRPGAGGGLMWSMINQMPADGFTVVGVNLPHIVFQPMQGDVQYKTGDIVPVYWFHYTPDVLLVPENSPYHTFKEFIAGAKANPGKFNIGGSGLNSANHAAHQRLDAEFGIKTTYVPYKGTSDMAIAVIGSQVDAAMSYVSMAMGNKGKVRALAVAMEHRHPALPDVPTFKELGVNWIDGAYRGIAVPKSTPVAARERISHLWAQLNTDPQMKDLAAQNGFELINIDYDHMDAFMKERIALYNENAKRLDFTKK